MLTKLHSLDTSYEQAERDMLISLAKPGDVLFDIGAYVGWYTVDFARKVPMSTVYAFEPIPEIRAELARNVKNFSNVFCYRTGLSNEIGEVDFNVSERETGTASMAPLEEDRFGPTVPVRCHVTTIDHLCESLPLPQFIKCDVEGAELKVFLGAIKLLEKTHPIILTEMLRKWSARYGYHPNNVIDYLGTFGYNCFVLRGGVLVPFPEMTDDTVETNFFFMHPGNDL
jgi:FkbM family methyltransferase